MGGWRRTGAPHRVERVALDSALTVVRVDSQARSSDLRRSVGHPMNHQEGGGPWIAASTIA